MTQHTDQALSGAYYDSGTPAVIVRALTVNDPAVVADSRRWSTGHRGTAVGERDMAGIDLSTFVSQALVAGTHAIGTAGGVQDTFNLERLVSDVGARTAESTSKAAGTITTEVVNRATEAMQKRRAKPRTEDVAYRLGLLLARSGTWDVVDAHVVLLARRLQAAVLTSDPDDLTALDPTLRLVTV